MRLTYAPGLFPPDQIAGCAPCAAGLGALNSEDCWRSDECFDPGPEQCPLGAQMLDAGMKADLLGLAVTLGLAGMIVGYLVWRK